MWHRLDSCLVNFSNAIFQLLLLLYIFFGKLLVVVFCVCVFWGVFHFFPFFCLTQGIAMSCTLIKKNNGHGYVCALIYEHPENSQN